MDQLDGYVPFDPNGSDIGASNVVAATISHTKQHMGRHYSDCMAKMEASLMANSDVFGILHFLV